MFFPGENPFLETLEKSIVELFFIDSIVRSLYLRRIDSLMRKGKKGCEKACIVGLLLLVLVGGLSGCVDEKSKFIGSWQTADGFTTFTFNNGNTVTIAGTGPFGMASLIGTFNYSIANQQVTFSAGSLGVTLNYSFPSSTKLILSNEQGASIVLNKT